MKSPISLQPSTTETEICRKIPAAKLSSQKVFPSASDHIGTGSLPRAHFSLTMLNTPHQEEELSINSGRWKTLW